MAASCHCDALCRSRQQAAAGPCQHSRREHLLGDGSAITTRLLQSPSLGFYHYEQWRQRRSDAGLPWILHAMISGMKGLGVWQGCWGRARCSPGWILDAMTSGLKELGVWRECLISAGRWSRWIVGAISFGPKGLGALAGKLGQCSSLATLNLARSGIEALDDFDMPPTTCTTDHAAGLTPEPISALDRPGLDDDDTGAATTSGRQRKYARKCQCIRAY